MDSTVVVAIIGAFISLTTLAYQVYKDRHQNKSALNRSVGFLLLNRLTDWCMHCINNGEITRQELKIIEDGYKLYHELGGNGFADAIVGQCRKLNIKEK